MSATDQPSEDELRAAYEAEIKRIGVDQILLEQVVTLINLGMRRTGLQPGTEDERDLAQVRTAIEAVRVLLPLVESAAGVSDEHRGQIREALSQMQLAYVRLGGDGAAASGPDAAPLPPEAPAAGPPSPSPGGPPPSPPGSPAPPEPPAPPTGGPAPAGEPTPPTGDPRDAPGSEHPGPAERSGRLWVPGQP